MGRISHTPEYRAWSDMRQRVNNPRNKFFKDYGGRGIRVCDRWQTSFASFLTDMGPKPDGFSIERNDNDGHYEPGNCRWASPSEQAKNRRSSVFYEVHGLRMTMTDWARHLRVNLGVLRNRLRHGWPIEKVFSPRTRSTKPPRDIPLRIIHQIQEDYRDKRFTQLELCKRHRMSSTTVIDIIHNRLGAYSIVDD